MVRQIKAIPDDVINYTEQEIFWMGLAIQNLEYMIDCYKKEGLDTEEMQKQKSLYESSIATNKMSATQDHSR